METTATTTQAPAKGSGITLARLTALAVGESLWSATVTGSASPVTKVALTSGNHGIGYNVTRPNGGGDRTDYCDLDFFQVYDNGHSNEWLLFDTAAEAVAHAQGHRLTGQALDTALHGAH